MLRFAKRLEGGETAQIYAFLAILGVMAIPASFILGFRYSADAGEVNYLWNFLMFAAFMAVHIVMLLPAFKKAVYGHLWERPARSFHIRPTSRRH